ncbi:hypothetical protein [Gordonia sp. SCSIO 19800]|uniref:hypothetical protein n=1 Tax=Gordonia sp. SCSIO 19800 TaxID=2826926 RepID=UPI001B8371D1|nr:hypothetical protein [Gordonia sp. SCSIO 19800]MBR7191637.1 hypothetical protein [Gordonia sp. SCSIO 19800]
MTSLVSVGFDEDAAVALRSNYRVLRSGALAEYGLSILGRSRLCCLCGLRDVSELDHYLPKTIFPEYSVLTLNLIPVCGVCNRLKSEHYKALDGRKAFIHAYFDDLPYEEEFLVARVDVDRAVLPFFEVAQTSQMSSETFDVLSGQFKRFGLAMYYAEEAVELLADKSDAIEGYFSDGGALAVQEYLARDARSVRKRHGANFWKSATLSAAASSTDFCEGGFRLLS